MTPRRRETAPREVVQPVGLYKSIAVTFLGLTIFLLGVILFISSKRATVTIETRGEPVSVRSVVLIDDEIKDDEPLRALLVTTTITLSQSFMPTGVSEEDGVATGTVTLVNTSGAAQPLVATTRVENPQGIIFRIREGVTVPANGSITVPVYADKPGKSGNIPAGDFIIPGLAPARRAQVFAKSSLPMSGGIKRTGQVSDDDVVAAKKTVIEAIKEKGKADLLARYAGQEGVFLVTNESYKEGASSGGQAVSYTVTGTAMVVGVVYDKEVLNTYAKSVLFAKSEAGSSLIRLAKTEPTVSLTAYRKEKNEAELEVLVDGVGTIHPENPAIQKAMFFGKTKDEVRRYALSIDRVRGVKVQFSPSWMLTVPHASDRVTVVVTEVE